MNTLDVACMSTREQLKLCSGRSQLLFNELLDKMSLDTSFTVREMICKLETLNGLSKKSQQDMLHTLLRWMEKYQPEPDTQPLAKRVMRGVWVLPS